jgi:hypothetical protein
MTSVWEAAVSIGMVEASVNVAEREKTSDTTREVAVGWFSDASEEGTSVPILKASIEEVGKLGRSSVEVAPAKSAMLLDKSSIADILETMASVVVGDEITSLENAVLRVIISVSVLATLVGPNERVWSSLVIVNVGNKVSDPTSSEIETVRVVSVWVATEPSKMLVRLSKISVRLSSGSINVAEAGRGASVGMNEESTVVLRAMVPVSVRSSCVKISVESSGMLDDADWSTIGAVVKVLSAPSVTEGDIKILVAPSGSEPTPRLIDTLAVGVTFMGSSDHVGDGGGI